MTKRYFLITIFSAICLLTFSCSNNQVSEQEIKETVYDIVNNNSEYYCEPISLTKGHNEKVSILNWKGAFPNGENEYQAKVVLLFNACKMNPSLTASEPANFIFVKNTDGKWLLNEITFDMANQWTKTPSALREWHKKISTQTFIIE